MVDAALQEVVGVDGRQRFHVDAASRRTFCNLTFKWVDLHQTQIED
jgi:hypothetical protein